MKKHIKIVSILLVTVLIFFCSNGSDLPMPNNPISGKKGNITINISPDPFPSGSVNLLVKWTIKETGGTDVNIDSIISNVYDSDGQLNTGYSESFKGQAEISQLFRGAFQVYELDSIYTTFNLNFVPVQGGRNEIIVYGRDRFRNSLLNSTIVDFE